MNAPSTPLVTIGIPCYNSAGSVRHAIESALAQTWPAVEVIVVDDGSTDSSLLIAGAFGDRILLRRAGHRGAPAARNIVLQEARGDWIQYLDADDYLEPTKIERQFAETEGSAAADVLYSPVWIEENGHRSASPLDAALDLPSQWLTWQLPQTGGALWRREALVALGGWRVDQPCCQEHELYLRALRAGLRFAFAPTPGAVYRIWSQETLCRRDNRLLVRTKTKLLDEARTWLEGKKQWSASLAALAGRACFEMARTLAQEDLAQAHAYYRERLGQGMLQASGPAAPWPYRLVYTLLGFTAAEALAKACR